MFKRILGLALFAAAAAFTVAPASAQVYTNGGSINADGLCSALTAGIASPCASTKGDNGFTAPALASATSAKIVTGVAGENIRVTYLAYSAYESATGGLLELLYGTGTNCGTGTTVLHVISNVPATTIVTGALGGGGNQLFIVPAGKDLCAEITAGTVTEASVAGTYAQY